MNESILDKLKRKARKKKFEKKVEAIKREQVELERERNKFV
jgi:hypothetical protein